MPEDMIALEPLFIGRARAANTGDRVPAGHVEKYGWDGKVAKEGTKAAKKALGVEEATTPSQTQPTRSGTASS